LTPLVPLFCAESKETIPEAWQRLFIGPWALPAPPWGSVWLDKEASFWRIHAGTSPVDA
jgi:TorA maturation chaperone TorD